MRLRRTSWMIGLFLGLFVATGARAQSSIEEIGPLPVTLSTEQVQVLSQLSDAGMRRASPETAQNHVPVPLSHPPQLLSPDETQYKLAVEKLGVNEHRFVHCELKDHSVVTGAIVAVGAQDFTVRPGKLREDRLIPYRELSATPRPTAAVGTHFKNGFEMIGLVGVCALLLPMCLAATGE